MASFTKIISANDYCNGGSTVYVPRVCQSFEERCDNTMSNDIYDNRFDDIDYYNKKSTGAFSDGFSSAFG